MGLGDHRVYNRQRAQAELKAALPQAILEYEKNRLLGEEHHLPFNYDQLVHDAITQPYTATEPYFNEESVELGLAQLIAQEQSNATTRKVEPQLPYLINSNPKN